MQIKRFEARTMTAALKMVKDEFGPDAVILSARTLRRGGLLGAARPTGVEVTAARDYTPSAPSDALRPPQAAPAAYGETGERRGIFSSLNEGLRALGRRRAESPGPGPDRPELMELHQHLLGQEVARDIAADVIARIPRLPGYDPGLRRAGLRPLAGAALEDLGLRREVGTVDRGTPRIVALVGPAGAGKTTLAIKLAAVEALGKGRRVALVTLDDQRIGAIEQLKIYAGVLGVALRTAPTAADAPAALADVGAAEVVVVDTPGVSPGEDDRRAEVRRTLSALGCREVHLVVNACTREKDSLTVIDAWKGTPVHHLAFTRLDEAGACGSLVNLLLRTRLPLSYLGTGPRIPEDLAERPADLLLSRLWPEAPAAAEPTTRRGTAVAEGLVANRSSDLYHRPTCKWVRKIKPENLVRFGSTAEAEARHFIACRNCSPEAAGVENAVWPDAGRRISAYR